MDGAATTNAERSLSPHAAGRSHMTNFSRALLRSRLRTISQRVVPANAGSHHPWPQSEKRPLLQCRNESPRRMGPCVRRDDSLIRHAYENSICDSPAASGARLIKEKDRPQRTGLSPFIIDQRRSEVLVRRGGGLVDGILCRFLGVAQSLLALAFDFLNRALALKFVGTDGFADARLGLADGFVGGAFNLVCRATH